MVIKRLECYLELFIRLLIISWLKKTDKNNEWIENPDFIVKSKSDDFRESRQLEGSE